MCRLKGGHNSPRPQTKMLPHGSPPQPPDCRLPRERRDNYKDAATLLLARDGKMDQRIHTRMHNMLRIKDLHLSGQGVTIQDPSSFRRQTLQASGNGLDHRITTDRQTQCHPYNCQPQMLTRRYLPTGIRYNHRGRHHTAIHGLRLQMVWTPY